MVAFSGPRWTLARDADRRRLRPPVGRGGQGQEVIARVHCRRWRPAAAPADALQCIACVHRLPLQPQGSQGTRDAAACTGALARARIIVRRPAGRLRGLDNRLRPCPPLRQRCRRQIRSPASSRPSARLRPALQYPRRASSESPRSFAEATASCIRTHVSGSAMTQRDAPAVYVTTQPSGSMLMAQASAHSPQCPASRCNSVRCRLSPACPANPGRRALVAFIIHR